MAKKVNLESYDNSWFKPGNSIKIFLWYMVNELVLKNSYLPFSSPRKLVLKFFGAKIGSGVIFKPGINVKYPWHLIIGDHCWIGENVWIDNLSQVTIENNVCLSQGAMLLCGNHNYKEATFDLKVEPIIIKTGAWLGAKTIVCPGVTIGSHSILSVGSIATKDLEAYCIYKGNPALKINDRIIN